MNDFEGTQAMLLSLNNAEMEEMDAALFGWDAPDLHDAPEWFCLTPGMES